MNAYNKIFNPYTNSFVNTNSTVGRYLFNNMMGGARYSSSLYPFLTREELKGIDTSNMTRAERDGILELKRRRQGGEPPAPLKNLDMSNMTRAERDHILELKRSRQSMQRGGATDDPECCRKLGVGLMSLEGSVNEKHGVLNDKILNLLKRVAAVEEVLKRINRQLQ